MSEIFKECYSLRHIEYKQVLHSSMLLSVRSQHVPVTTGLEVDVEEAETSPRATNILAILP